MSPRRGDAAVRELSARLDKWEPQQFRLTNEQIRALIGSLPAQTVDDIKFAQAQIRRFAEAQTRQPARLRDRDAARHPPRPAQHPGQQRRLLRAGRAIPDGGVGAYEHRHRARRRGEAGDRLHAAAQRPAAGRDGRRDGARRRRRDLSPWRRPGGRGDGPRHCDDRGRGHAGRPRQRLCRGSQAAVVRPRRHRPARRPDRDADHCRRQRRRGDVRDRPARPGRARPDLARGAADHLEPHRRRHRGGDRKPTRKAADRRRRRAWRGATTAR